VNVSFSFSENPRMLRYNNRERFQHLLLSGELLFEVYYAMDLSIMSRNGSVCIVTDYGLDALGSILGGGKRFLSFP
jgi:hypothetical protein